MVFSLANASTLQHQSMGAEISIILQEPCENGLHKQVVSCGVTLERDLPFFTAITVRTDLPITDTRRASGLNDSVKSDSNFAIA